MFNKSYTVAVEQEAVGMGTTCVDPRLQQTVTAVTTGEIGDHRIGLGRIYRIDKIHANIQIHRRTVGRDAVVKGAGFAAGQRLGVLPQRHGLACFRVDHVVVIAFGGHNVQIPVVYEIFKLTGRTVFIVRPINNVHFNGITCRQNGHMLLVEGGAIHMLAAADAGADSLNTPVQSRGNRLFAS